MVIKKLTEMQKEFYLNLFKKHNEDGVCKKAVGGGIVSLTHDPNPDIVLMDLSDSFFAYFRQTGEEEYFQIARALRRAAHIVYRELIRQNKKKNSIRFLNVV